MPGRDDQPVDVTPLTDPADAPQPTPRPDVRRRAEEIARQRAALSEGDLAALSIDEVRALLHELHVRQAELEIQNQELRRTQTSLQAARDHYADLYLLAPAGSVTLNERGLVQTANHRAAVLLGVNRAGLTGQLLSRFVVAEDRDTYIRYQRRLFATPSARSAEGAEPLACEVRMNNKDAGPFWARLEATTVRPPRGAFVSHIIISDVTREKQAQQALRESEAFLSAVFESIQDGITVLDPDLTIRHVNPVMERWYAASAPLEGKKCFRVGRGRESPCQPCPALRCIESGEVEHDVVQGLADPDSPNRWLELFSYPLRDPDSGDITGVVEFVRDITSRREARVRLDEQLDELRRWHSATLGREMRILELKREVNQLLARAGQPPRYASAEETHSGEPREAGP
ncbi:MAG: PAS domain-containing protein [Chloroflexota bacterium]